MKLMDFSGPDLPEWYVVNDDVMGGRSAGGLQIESGRLLFAGTTNTDGGGFSSIRTDVQALDLSARLGIRLRLRGDGRTYRFRLETAAGIAYFASFDTASGAGWQTIDVPFDRFEPRRRGRPLAGPPLDTARITGLGLMIYDRLDGPFRLEVDGIGSY